MRDAIDRNAWADRTDTTPIRPDKADHEGWLWALRHALPPRPHPAPRLNTIDRKA